MSVEESRIRVVLKDNTILDFDRKCTNEVDFEIMEDDVND